MEPGDLEGDEIGQGPESPGDETDFLAESISNSKKIGCS